MNRLLREKKTVEFMIRLYCRKKERNTVLCAECEALLRYAHARLDRCRHGVRKPSCQQCPAPCYRPLFRERMRQIMRFSGPRMLLYAPAAAIRHLLDNRRR